MQRIVRLAYPRSPGPAPTFSILHIVRVLLIIGDTGPIGRGELARDVNVGEGVVRTVIRRLVASGIVRVQTDGCVLTRKGSDLFRSLKDLVPRATSIKVRPVSMDTYDVSLLIRRGASKLRSGIEQRDAAIKAGATGAVSLGVRRGRILIPPSGEDCENVYSDPVWKQLREQLRPREGDAIVISSAGSRVAAEHGALAAALTLI